MAAHRPFGVNVPSARDGRTIGITLHVVMDADKSEPVNDIETATVGIF